MEKKKFPSIKLLFSDFATGGQQRTGRLLQEARGEQGFGRGLWRGPAAGTQTLATGLRRTPRWCGLGSGSKGKEDEMPARRRSLASAQGGN